MRIVKLHDDTLNNWLNAYEAEEDRALRRGEIPAPDSLVRQKSIEKEEDFEDIE